GEVGLMMPAAPKVHGVRRKEVRWPPSGTKANLAPHHRMGGLNPGATALAVATDTLWVPSGTKANLAPQHRMGGLRMSMSRKQFKTALDQVAKTLRGHGECAPLTHVSSYGLGRSDGPVTGKTART